MGHEKGVALGVPPNIGRREGVTGGEKGARGDGDGRQGEKAREGARGSEEILTWEGGERGTEGQRVRGNFIMGYDPLGWGVALMETGRGNFIMRHEKGVALGVPPTWDTRRGWLWGSPQYREVRRGERGWQGAERGARGDGDGRHGERGARGGQRVRGNFNMEGGREGARRGGKGREGGERGARGGQRVRGNFVMGYDPLGWGGNIHGIRKKKFYHGIRPFRVRGEHSWNQEE